MVVENEVGIVYSLKDESKNAMALDEKESNKEPIFGVEATQI